jgi:hypothetical protein
VDHPVFLLSNKADINRCRHRVFRSVSNTLNFRDLHPEHLLSTHRRVHPHRQIQPIIGLHAEHAPPVHHVACLIDCWAPVPSWELDCSFASLEHGRRQVIEPCGGVGPVTWVRSPSPAPLFQRGRARVGQQQQIRGTRPTRRLCGLIKSTLSLVLAGAGREFASRVVRFRPRTSADIEGRAL